MKERPIIFSGDMVRAILDGRKTQTRRIVKKNAAGRVQLASKNWHLDDPDAVLACPYGQIGDRLWVRENFAVQPELWERDHLAQPVHYMADICDKRTIEDYVCKPSIHMPRWASRITLEIENIRVERVRDISEQDAASEGFKKINYYMADGSIDEGMSISPRCNFAYWWAGKYGLESWNSNPWVWVIEFKRV